MQSSTESTTDKAPLQAAELKARTPSLTPELLLAAIQTSGSAGTFLQATAGRLADEDLLSTGRSLVAQQEGSGVLRVLEREAAKGPAIELAQLESSNSSQPILVDIPGVSPFSLSWLNVSVRAKSSDAFLLRNVSGLIAGGLHACMSASGGGKSTLLNALACRLDDSLTFQGEMRLNGQLYNAATLKQVAAYVLQDDLLHSHLTVLETLKYSAFLKLPRSWTKEEKLARVDEVLEWLGLTRVRDFLIGDTERKGISGGERKRLCIAMAIINKPALLLGDEITSGLDSKTAMDLMVRLRKLTRLDGCTILTTIHQPSSKLFQLFDGLILMKTGEIVYSGPVAGALLTLEGFGFPCPPFSNPADHLLDVLSDSHQVRQSGPAQPEAGGNAGDLDDSLLKLQRKRFERVLDHQADHFNEKLSTASLQLSSILLEREKENLPWWNQFLILFHRCFIEFLHQRQAFYIAIAQALLIALLIGTVFLQLDHSQPMVARRSAVLFFCCVNQGVFGSLSVIHSFPLERSIVLRERASGLYRVSAYFIAKSFMDSLPQIFLPILFSCMVYFLIGLRAEDSAGPFFLFTLFMILCSLAATSMALMISCLCRRASLSLVILPLLFEISRLFGGFFLSPAGLPNYFLWLDALSYIKYAYIGISLSEFDSIAFKCPATGNCAFPTGQQQIRALGLDYISIGGCVGALMAYIIGTRIIAYLAIRYRK